MCITSQYVTVVLTLVWNSDTFIPEDLNAISFGGQNEIRCGYISELTFRFFLVESKVRAVVFGHRAQGATVVKTSVIYKLFSVPDLTKS